MISRYRISLNGVELDSLNDDLLILDISNTQPERNIRKNTIANLDGVEIGNEYVGQQSVTVSFELHIYDTIERNKALQAVNNWASKGGKLRLNDREGQYLADAKCEQYADMGSVRNWTDPLTLVFASTNIPYWMSEDAVVRTLTGKSGSSTLAVDGNVGSALVGVEFTTTEAVSSLQVNCGSDKMKLTGLSVPSGKKIIIDYLKNRYLRIRANGASVLAKLDPSSSDNLKAECGKNTSVSFVSNGKVTAVFTARGYWI